MNERNERERHFSSQHDVWLEKKHDILSRLHPDEVERLYRFSERTLKRRGEILWLEVDAPRVYIVDQGYLRICQTNEEGKRLILSLLGPADFFGLIAPGVMSFAEDYTLEVVRDVRLISIEAPVFQDVLQSHPEMTMRMVRLLDERQKNLEKRISDLLFKDVYARLSVLLLELSTKYGDACPHDPGRRRDIRMTHQELSDFLGVARPTVSAILSEFSQHALVEKHDQRLCVSRSSALEIVMQHGSEGFKSLHQLYL